MMKGRKTWVNLICGLIAVAAITSAGARAKAEELPAEFTEQNENKEIGIIPFLSRVQIVDSNERFPYGSPLERASMMRAYQQGLATENEISQFYPADYRDRVKQNWQRIRFSMMESKKESISIDYQSRDRALMLRYKIKLN